VQCVAVCCSVGMENDVREGELLMCSVLQCVAV